MSPIFIPVLVFFLLLYLSIPGRVLGFLSASSIFVYAQFLMALGAGPLLDERTPADAVHVLLMMATFGGIVIATTIATFVAKDRKQFTFAGEVTAYKPGAAVWLLIALSIAISVLYYASIGYVALFEALDSTLSGGSDDIAGLRLESYSGSRYFFPGYVNQFKNVLLPALVVIVIDHAYRTKTPGRLLLSLILAIPTIVLILGTGQRGAFVTFFLILVIYIRLAHREVFGRVAIGLGIIGMSFFFIATFALGRARQELDATDDFAAKLGILFNQLVYRLTGSNQESSVVGFRFVSGEETQFGADWANSIAGLLPGVTGSDLDNRIFETLYGSTRGTSPPSTWGSAYYNFGFAGTLVLAIVLALVLFSVSRMGREFTTMNSVQAIGLAGIFGTLGSWIAGTPTYLLNFGLAVYVVLWLVGKRIATREFASAHEQKRRGRQLT